MPIWARLFWRVGERGFEPPTSSTRTTRATKLRYSPTTFSSIPQRPLPTKFAPPCSPSTVDPLFTLIGNLPRPAPQHGCTHGARRSVNRDPWKTNDFAGIFCCAILLHTSCCLQPAAATYRCRCTHQTPSRETSRPFGAGVRPMGHPANGDKHD